MRAYFGPNIAEVFEMILEDLWEDSDFVTSPRGMEVKEIIDCSMEIENPMLNIYTNKHRSSPLKYCCAEILWYFAGTNNPTYIENYASLWKSLHNPDGTVNSSYGNLLFTEKNKHGLTQYNWVIESLKKDKDSRQAFMHFNKPHHQFLENKDQVCTLQALFHIRKNKLYMTLTMRSNDVIYGFMTDWAFFSILQYHVLLHMKKYYPELEMGSYTHISHSMHLYERHYDLVKKMSSKPYYKREPFIPKSLPLLNEPILDETGKILEKYAKLLEPIQKGKIPNYNQQTGNTLIDWCLNKLK
jgi:thymidylate synthase